MKNDKTFLRWTLVGLGALLALPVWAQDDGYFYGGLALGKARAKIDQDRITAGLKAGGLTTTDFTRNESGTAYKLFGGYQFNRNIALEAGYFDLGKFGFGATTVPAGTLNGDIRLNGFNLDLVGTLPLGDRWALLGRLGGQSARASDRFSSTGAIGVISPNPTQRETNYKYGGGLQYAVSNAFLLRLEAEHYRINDAVGNHGGVNTVLLSLVFPFGRRAEAAPRVAMVAPYVAPAPRMAAAPVMVAPPPPSPPPAPVVPERRRVNFSAESLFAFDRAEVAPEGRVALDRFAKEMAGTRFDVVVVVGHTDRIGSSAYNQRLSEQRASAVKNYLVASGGIDGARITTEGKGAANAVTGPQDCKGEVQNAKLIACLQADRRVEVEVTGTR